MMAPQTGSLTKVILQGQLSFELVLFRYYGRYVISSYNTFT